MTQNRLSVILLAGGQGLRLKKNLPKQFIKVFSKPLISYSLEVFEKLSFVSEIILVAKKNYWPSISGNVKFAEAGKRRQDSVKNGLDLVDKRSNYVLVHDGARPLISEDLVENLYLEAKKNKAVALAVPAQNTMKKTCSLKGTYTLNRSNLWEVQTPQIIEKTLFIRAYQHLDKLDNPTVTDDLSIVELIDHPVNLIRGSRLNFKVTYPEDLYLFESIVQRQISEDTCIGTNS